MTSRDFAYWLQGLFELGEPKTLNEEQTAKIKAHLALVFIHDIDPSAGDAARQAKLNAVHHGDIVVTTENADVKTGQTVPNPMAPPGSAPQIGGVEPGGVVYRC